MLTLERYLELDKGICSPVTGLICLLGAQGAQGLAGSRRVFPQGSYRMQSWALAVPWWHVCLLGAHRLCPALF